jgi:AraC family transcriptional regulator of adaptative response / DNA-3-methyladenine glycosylase II
METRSDLDAEALERASPAVRAPRRARRRAHVPSRAPGRSTPEVLQLKYRPPYDWLRLRDFLATRAVAGVERVEARGYARTVACAGGHAVVCVTDVAGEDVLEVRVTGAPQGALPELESVARRVFDVAADPQRIQGGLASDALLGPLVRRSPGLRIPGVWDPFECAVRAVLGQQVSVAAGRTLAARLVARAGTAVRGGGEGLTHLFPGPAVLAGADLDGLGITGTRVAALHALATAVAERRIDFGAPSGAVVAALAQLPGVGPWTAQYVAMRALGERDALPDGDLVLRRMAAPAGTLLSARELEARARAWQPWRGYAVIHLWRAAAAQHARRR